MGWAWGGAGQPGACKERAGGGWPGPRPAPTQPSVSRVLPGKAGAERHGQGDGELVRSAHGFAHKRAQVVQLARGDLEEKLVVHLEQHPRREAPRAERTV